MSILSGLFSHKSSRKPAISPIRSDGLKPDYARLICAFQAIIEREPGRCNYDALRASLAYGRFASDNNLPLSLMVLRAKYNDYIYSDGCYTSNHR